jgi:hypothetical protein
MGALSVLDLYTLKTPYVTLLRVNYQLSHMADLTESIWNEVAVPNFKTSEMHRRRSTYKGPINYGGALAGALDRARQYII